MLYVYELVLNLEDPDPYELRGELIKRTTTKIFWRVEKKSYTKETNERYVLSQI